MATTSGALDTATERSVEGTYGYGLSVQPFPEDILVGHGARTYSSATARGHTRRPRREDTLVGHGGMMGRTTAFMIFLDDIEVELVIVCNTAPAHNPTVAGHALLAVLQGEDPETAVS